MEGFGYVIKGENVVINAIPTGRAVEVKGEYVIGGCVFSTILLMDALNNDGANTVIIHGDVQLA